MVWGRSKSEKSAKSGSAPLVADAAGTGTPPNADVPDVPADTAPQGADKQASMAAMAEAVQKARFAQHFAQAVAVLMRDRTYGNMPVRNLEFLLVPAVASGQCVLGHTRAREKGPLVPVAVALWASVSSEIDARLSADLDKPIQLKPNEWQSGDQIWLVTLAGEPGIMNGFLKQLLEKDLKGKVVKMRVVAKDGKRQVKTLQVAG